MCAKQHQVHRWVPREQRSAKQQATYFKKGENPCPEHLRCQAKLKGDRKCGMRARAGSRFCKWHGGRNSKDRTRTRTYHLPGFYSKYLTRTLSEAVEAMTSLAPAQQLQLFDELALMRQVAGQSVELYSMAVLAVEQCTDENKRKALEPLRGQAAMMMQDQLRSVADICERAAKINAMAHDKVSIFTLHHFVDQVVRCAYDAFGEESDEARDFETLVRTQIKIPSSGEQGTALTPDMDAQMMDSTIPSAPGESEGDGDDDDRETTDGDG